MDWIHLEDMTYGNNLVHEVKCPNCGYKITYHGNHKLPDSCYICETKLTDNKETNKEARNGKAQD